MPNGEFKNLKNSMCWNAHIIFIPIGCTGAN